MAISQKLELVKTNPHCQNNKIVKTFLRDLQIKNKAHFISLHFKSWIKSSAFS